jgi:hypothetical protein
MIISKWLHSQKKGIWHGSITSTRNRTVVCHLTTGIRSEKRVVRRFCRANVIVYSHKPWNLALTWLPYGWNFLLASISRICRFHPYWRFVLASNFPPQSAYLEFLKILTTVVYVVRCWPERRYAAHDCTYIYRWQQAYMPRFSWVQQLMYFLPLKDTILKSMAAESEYCYWRNLWLHREDDTKLRSIYLWKHQSFK